MSSRPIFISHAVVDKDIADQVVDLLDTAMGINVQGDVFCCSLEGLGIPAGKDFKDFIHSQIQEPKIVILLITQNYITSQFCLSEAGATWAFSHRMIPFIVPPATYDDMEAVLEGTQALKIDQPEEWNDALEVFKHEFGIDPNTNRWERKRNEHIERIKEAIKQQPDPSTISFVKHQEVLKQLEDANEEIQDLEKKEEEGQKLIETLKGLKDAVEVDEALLEGMGSLKRLDVLLATVKEALHQLPWVVRKAAFHKMRSEQLPDPVFGEEETIKDIENAMEREMLSHYDPGYEIDDTHHAVEQAIDCLEETRRFINEEITADEIKLFRQQSGYPLSLTNRDFWIERGLL